MRIVPIYDTQKSVPKITTPIATCTARVCRYCRPRDAHGVERPRPLTADDLRWLWQDAESELGVRSTHGAFVDMALIGPPSGGGRTNNAEARAVEAYRLQAVARERCIRQRLARAPHDAVAILRAAYGPEDWTACHSQVNLRTGQTPNPLTAPEVFSAARSAWNPEVLRLAPLTPIARAYEVRKRAGPPTPPRPSRPRHEAHDAPLPAAQSLARLFERDPLLARSARGAALSAACGICPGCGSQNKCGVASVLDAQAREMLRRAWAAAGILSDKPRAPRVRTVRHDAPIRAAEYRRPSVTG